MSEDFELTLWDRLEMIRSVLQSVPYEIVYLSFSGGKDSTVLHHMLDEALPGNTIDRVYSDTGIEFNAVSSFVRELAAKDDRIKIIAPGKNIKQMLEEVGYPFKSKFHSEMVDRYQKSEGGNNQLNVIFKIPESLADSMFQSVWSISSRQSSSSKSAKNAAVN